MSGELSVRHRPPGRSGTGRMRLPNVQCRAGCVPAYLRERRFGNTGRTHSMRMKLQLKGYFGSAQGGVNSQQAIKIARSVLRDGSSLWGGSPDAFTD